MIRTFELIYSSDNEIITHVKELDTNSLKRLPGGGYGCNLEYYPEQTIVRLPMDNKGNINYLPLLQKEINNKLRSYVLVFRDNGDGAVPVGVEELDTYKLKKLDNGDWKYGEIIYPGYTVVQMPYTKNVSI